MAVRAACHRGWTAGEDRLEIATLRAGRVRAAMLGFCMGLMTVTFFFVFFFLSIFLSFFFSFFILFFI